MKITALASLFFVVVYSDDADEESRSSEYVDYTRELGTCNRDDYTNINAENALTVTLVQGIVDLVDQKTGHRQMVLLAKGRRRFLQKYGKHDWEDGESKLDEGIRLNCTALLEVICDYATSTSIPPRLPCNSKRKYYRGNKDAVMTVKETMGNDFVLPMTTEERLEYLENWTKLAQKLPHEYVNWEPYWNKTENGWLRILLRDYYNPSVHD